MKYNREFWLSWFQRQIDFLTLIDPEKGSPNTVFDVLGDVFDLTTYDDNVTELFVRSIMDVLGAIIDRKTFEYQQLSRQNYLTYLIVVHHDRIHPMLNWGTSIRGAFLFMPPKGYHLGDPCGHEIDKEENITIETVEEYIEFIKAGRELIATHDQNKGTA